MQVRLPVEFLVKDHTRDTHIRDKINCRSKQNKRVGVVVL
jgi:hypothetical protein